jgi:hypothetical protein
MGVFSKSGVNLGVCAYCKCELDETWKDVLGFEGRYQVSNFGNVRTLDRVCHNHNGGSYKRKGGRLNPTINNNGYYHVSLWNLKNKKSEIHRVHVLVAMAFINHIPCGMKYVIDHIDGDKLNNHIDNLQITTQRVNSSKASRKKSSKYVGVSFDKSRNKWTANIYYNSKRKSLGRYNCEFTAYVSYNKELKKINNEGVQ